MIPAALRRELLRLGLSCDECDGVGTIRGGVDKFTCQPCDGTGLRDMVRLPGHYWMNGVRHDDGQALLVIPAEWVE